MLARNLVVYSICSLRTYTLYLVSLITNNLCYITVLFICQINHYHTIIWTLSLSMKDLHILYSLHYYFKIPS